MTTAQDLIQGLRTKIEEKIAIEESEIEKYKKLESTDFMYFFQSDATSLYKCYWFVKELKRILRYINSDTTIEEIKQYLKTSIQKATINLLGSLSIEATNFIQLSLINRECTLEMVKAQNAYLQFLENEGA